MYGTLNCLPPVSSETCILTVVNMFMFLLHAREALIESTSKILFQTIVLEIIMGHSGFPMVCPRRFVRIVNPPTAWQVSANSGARYLLIALSDWPVRMRSSDIGSYSARPRRPIASERCHQGAMNFSLESIYYCRWITTMASLKATPVLTIDTQSTSNPADIFYIFKLQPLKCPPTLS